MKTGTELFTHTEHCSHYTKHVLRRMAATDWPGGRNEAVRGLAPHLGGEDEEETGLQQRGETIETGWRTSQSNTKRWHENR
jgi:hypothetical protein